MIKGSCPQTCCARKWAFCVALTLLCFGCAHPEPPSNQPTSGTWQRITIGLCEDYPASTRSIENTRSDLLLLKTNEICYLRTAIAWDALEPEPGVFDWKFLDALADNAKELGLILIPYVCYTPEWAARDTNAFWTQPPRDFAQYGRVVEELARRYKGRIDSWEIWNEPDNREYWAGSVQEYGELLKIGSQAVRRGNPNARVVSGGLAWNLDFLRTLLEDTNVMAAVDVVNLHNYYETWSEDGVEDIARYVNRALRVLSKATGKQPIWLAELGYSTFRTNHYVSDAYRAEYLFEHTSEFQSATLFRMLVPLMASTPARLAAWYRIHDLPKTTGIIGDVNNRHLGILDTNNNLKPAALALRFCNDLFRDGYVPYDRRLLVTAPADSSAQVHGFLRKDGSLAIIMWLKVVDPERQYPARISEELVKVRIPDEFASAGEVFDPTGRFLRKITTDSKTHTAQVSLQPGKVQILVFQAGNLGSQ